MYNRVEGSTGLRVRLVWEYSGMVPSSDAPVHHRYSSIQGKY
jgi:hypothetical protein